MDKVPEKGIFQEFSCLTDSDERKKVDGFILFSNGVTEDIKDANIGRWGLQSLKSEPNYDLRKSLAWDSAFSTSKGFLEAEELFNILNSRHNENGYDILRHEKDQLLSVNYPEPEIKIIADEFNSRRSFAWDSAFFTSEGILNPEELSLVNKGFKKSEVNKLPRIEELWTSSESNCTINNDGSSLASLEVELFEDIRASMPQLRGASSTIASSSRKKRYRKMQKAHSTERIAGDGVPKLKVKSRAKSKMQTIKSNQLERNKESSIFPLRKVNSLLAKENGGGMSHSSTQNGITKMGACSRNINAVSKFQTAKTFNDVRNTKICPRPTKRSPVVLQENLIGVQNKLKGCEIS